MKCHFTHRHYTSLFVELLVHSKEDIKFLLLYWRSLVRNQLCVCVCVCLCVGVCVCICVCVCVCVCIYIYIYIYIYIFNRVPPPIVNNQLYTNNFQAIQPHTSFPAFLPYTVELWHITPNIKPSLLSIHASLWLEVTYYPECWYTAALDIAPQIAVKT